jgi:hypothetical protein
MTAGAAAPPEHPPRWTHPDSGGGGRGDDNGKNGVGGGSSTVRDNDYDADGDHHRRRCPRGAVTADVMMTMAGERGGEAPARRQQGDGDGNKATTRQQGCEGNWLWRRRWQGTRG